MCNEEYQTLTDNSTPEWVAAGREPIGSGFNIFTRGDAVKREPVRWFITDVVPRHALTLVAGAPGAGKSTIVCKWVADATKRGDTVAMFLGEDMPETVMGRIEAAGGDSSKVLLARIEDMPYRLPNDQDWFRDLFRKWKPALVIIDPLKGLAGGRVDDHKETDVRKYLQALKSAAGDATVIGLIHRRKGTGGTAVEQVAGSLAYGAVARSVVSVQQQDGRGVCEVVKTNLTDRRVKLTFELKTVALPGGAAASTAHFTTDFSAEELALGVDTDLNAYITETLAGGAVPTQQILSQGKKYGFNDKEMRRAAKELGVEFKRDPYTTKWFWLAAAIDPREWTNQRREMLKRQADTAAEN